MENVSTGVHENKIKNIIQEVKIKPKNDMMYQDIYMYMKFLWQINVSFVNYMYLRNYSHVF